MDALSMGISYVVPCCYSWVFVENQREHFVEHQREKQFVQSLYNDLEADTLKLISVIQNRVLREGRLDSMQYLMNSDEASSHTNEIYYYAVSAARSLLTRFVPNDGTMQQLKNSGAFRLIRNRTVADSIAKYDVSVRNYIRQMELEETLINDYRNASAKIFNSLFFDQMLDEDNNINKLPPGNPPLLPYNKTDLYEWNYKLSSVKNLNKANRRDGRLLLKQAKNLLSILEKGYSIK